jgi:hypothetical protein
MLPYPSAANAEEALGVVWASVTGGTVNVGDLTQAGWILSGYAASIGQVITSPAAIASARNLDKTTATAALKSVLEPHLRPFVKPNGILGTGLGGGLLSGLPWATIIQLILQILGGLAGGGTPPVPAPAARPSAYPPARMNEGSGDDPLKR